jgi:hypothetical protein
MPGGAQVDDAEAVVSERYSMLAVEEVAAIIRPAMRYGVGHSDEMAIVAFSSAF